MEGLVNGFLIAIIAGLIGWIAWASKGITNNSKDIQLLKKSETNHDEDVSDLKKAFEDQAEKVNKTLTRVEGRLDLFLQKEIEELKSIIHYQK